MPSKTPYWNARLSLAIRSEQLKKANRAHFPSCADFAEWQGYQIGMIFRHALDAKNEGY